MIPKIIHLCWLSGDDFPSSIKECLLSWGVHLKDYEIWLWGKKPADMSCLGELKVTEKTFDINQTDWTKEAYNAKKYAFAADYIRLYALFNYGGIYLDSDVIMYKSFNSLLGLPYFIGHDQIRGFEAAIIGTKKGCIWIKDMLDSYKGKHFLTDNGSCDMLPLPCRFHHVLTALGYKFYRLTEISEYEERDKEMMVFDKDFFNSRNTIEVSKTPKSFCAHNYADSWSNKDEKKSIKHRLPKWLLKTIYIVGQKTWARHKYSWFQIKFSDKR